MVGRIQGNSSLHHEKEAIRRTPANGAEHIPAPFDRRPEQLRFLKITTLAAFTAGELQRPMARRRSLGDG
jgi:hypothetical protein